MRQNHNYSQETADGFAIVIWLWEANRMFFGKRPDEGLYGLHPVFLTPIYLLIQNLWYKALYKL